jgi:diguanylate cyclase (GGDEF)-like protein
MEPAVLTTATGRPGAEAARKDRRLRAVYRRELQDSVRFSALVVVCAIALALVSDCLTSPRLAAAILLSEAPLVVAGLAIFGVVRHHGRHFAIPLGMVVGLLPILSSMATVVLIPGTEARAVASIGVVPLAFAQFIPLRRREHIAWLGLASAVFVAFMLLHGSAMDPSHARAMMFASLLGTVLSVGANEVALRRRGQIDSQLLAVRALYARMKEHEVDLRRQDEFLFMQQETLVVQQAELLRLNEELETIARMDPLTGLGNRLRLNEDLAQLAARIERHGGTAGLLLMDLDRFKRLNDTMGHLAGDAALRGVADILRKTSRSGDGVYRYGGEEFLVLLHDADQAVLESAGQRYLTAIQLAGMAHPDNPPYGVVTASAGVRELSQINCGDVDSALHDADEALYRAKEHGRNKLELHRGAGPMAVVAIERRRAAS